MREILKQAQKTPVINLDWLMAYAINKRLSPDNDIDLKSQIDGALSELVFATKSKQPLMIKTKAHKLKNIFNYFGLERDGFLVEIIERSNEDGFEVHSEIIKLLNDTKLVNIQQFKLAVSEISLEEVDELIKKLRR